MSLTHALIQELLARRHSSFEWKFFPEFRPLTGWGATANAIDAVAVGIYKKHAKIVSYEIKVTREDFISDVRVFKKKHQYALMMSHEFYYICPWNIINKAEVPEVAGLYYVNQKNRISLIKHAVYREQECIPFAIVQGFVSKVSEAIHDAKIPVNYLGKALTQEDFLELLEKEKGQYWKEEVRCEAQRQRLQEVEKGKARRVSMQQIMATCGLYSMPEAEAVPIIEKYCTAGKELLSDGDFRYRLNNLKEALAKVDGILEAKNK